MSYKLTAEDVKALRAAETVTFHTNKHDGPAGEEYTTIIRCHKAFKTGNGWQSSGVTTAQYDVAAAVRWTVYSATYESDHSAFRSAYAYVPGTYNPVWQTIARLLKAGDVLVLKWIADNNSQTIEKAGLHSDELRMIVQRDSRPDYEFIVDHTITPDNPARMVRR